MNAISRQFDTPRNTPPLWFIRGLVFLLCAILLVSSASATSHACPNSTNPPCSTGFPLYFGEVPAGGNTNENFSSSTGVSSPAVVDLDGRGRKDIVVGSNYGVFAYHSDGSFAWVFPTDTVVGTKPAVGDIDGTGEQQIAVTTGSVNTTAQGGTLYVLHHNGALKCSYHYEAGARSSPALAPLDRTRPDKLEIVFGIWGATSFHILALNPDCTVFWDKSQNDLVVDSVWSSAAIADLDGDGQLDVIIGQDSNAQTVNGVTTPNGGMLRAFRGDGNGELPGFPRTYDEVLWSSPSIGPVGGAGQLSIVAGNGRCWDVLKCAPGGHTHPVTESILGWTSTGADLPGWPVSVIGRDARTISPALADLFGDGRAEMILSLKIKASVNDDLTGEMHVLDGDGKELPGWPVQPNIPAGGGVNSHWLAESSPIVADLKGDGHFEILLATNAEVVVWDTNGNQLSRDANTVSDPNVYKLLGIGHFNSTPVAVDLDGSGQITVIAAGNYKDTAGQFWGALNAWKFPGAASARTLPWPMFRHDIRNSGLYIPDEVFASGFE